MTCAWKELLAILPVWMRKEVDLQKDMLPQELRLRINAPPELVFSDKSTWLNRTVSSEDLSYTVNAASSYSPWTAASTAKGYISVSGGHRIGICGEAVIQQGRMTGFRNISSLCIRIARDFSGIAKNLKEIPGSFLLIGPPGSGKTTLLRDLIRQKAQTEIVCVVDERKELFPEGLPGGNRIDILSGCSKKEGIQILLRTMGPNYIAMDEITDSEDTNALLEAANCGVYLMATAHAASLTDYQRRRIYQPLWENQIFPSVLILQKDKSYTVERMTEWTTNGSVQS